MSIRGRALRRFTGHLALICIALAVGLAILLSLTVREYSHYARIFTEGEDASAVAHKLKSAPMLKGGALSAMKGDFSVNLYNSIAYPHGRANTALNSYSPDTSLLAMRKLCVTGRGRILTVRYFSYDRKCAENTFGFFLEKSLSAIPSTLKEVDSGVSLPWRTMTAVSVLILCIFALACLVKWCILALKHKSAGLSSVRDVLSAVSKSGGSFSDRKGKDILLGCMEDIPLSRQRYANVLRWKTQSEAIAKRIDDLLNGLSSPVVNILGLRASDIYKFRRYGILSCLAESRRTHIIDGEKGADAFSAAYQYPDIEELKKSNEGSLLVITHPPLSAFKIPSAYLECASLNILVSDASEGWQDSHSALLENMPRIKLVVVGMPAGSVPVGKDITRRISAARNYMPSEKRYRFAVLIYGSYTRQLLDKTCRSLYFSATGAEAGSEDNLAEVFAKDVEYSVRSFRQGSCKMLQNIGFSRDDADAVVVLRAGCVVCDSFFKDVSAALYAGADAVLFRSRGRSSARTKIKNCRIITNSQLMELDDNFAATLYALEGKKAGPKKIFIDFLADTSVYFL